MEAQNYEIPQLIVFPNYLQKSLVHYQVSSGEVKGAVLTQLSIPVLTPRPVGWVQIERLRKLTS